MIKCIEDIPKRFTIANSNIIIKIVDNLNGDYGNWSSSTNTISIAKCMGVVELTQEQVINTFWHEVFHVFQFYFNNKYKEAQAQCYANFMREFEESCKWN